MKKVDNFEIINNLLEYNSEDDFYYLQIIKLKKDNSNLSKNEKLIKTYYLESGDLKKYKDDIIEICKLNNARAYIRLNKRSYKDSAFKVNIKISELLYSNQFKSVKNIFDSVINEHQLGSDKIWMMNIDSNNKELLNNYINIINTITEDSNIIKSIITTVCGFHIISKPFNSKLFRQHCIINKLPEIGIYKDSPTLLYFENIT